MASDDSTVARPGYQGTERLLWGIVLGVVTFWLFACTTGTVAPSILNDINSDPSRPFMDVNAMNLAAFITALFSGIFIVVMGWWVVVPSRDSPRRASCRPRWRL